ncbi:MAG: hypothetical protein NTX61_00970 [Bacteroidetes bacterium]|nr:hypothetical protein [Bacteroidota bacterium]
MIFYSDYCSGKEKRDYLLSVVFFIFSLLSKGQAVILAAILPLIDLVSVRKWLSGKILSKKIHFFVLSLVFEWIAFRA